MKLHDLKIRVYYEDTDAAGIVYYANYLKFAERARTEMMRAVGFEHAQVFEDKQTAFAIANVNVTYKAPAKLDDELVVKSQVLEIRGASMDMQQDIYKNDKLINEIKITLVCIDKNLKAVRIPQEVRDIFDKENK